MSPDGHTKFGIKCGGNGRTTHVTIDGEPISHLCEEIKFEVTAGGIARLTIGVLTPILQMAMYAACPDDLKQALKTIQRYSGKDGQIRFEGQKDSDG